MSDLALEPNEPGRYGDSSTVEPLIESLVRAAEVRRQPPDSSPHTFGSKPSAVKQLAIASELPDDLAELWYVRGHLHSPSATRQRGSTYQACWGTDTRANLLSMVIRLPRVEDRLGCRVDQANEAAIARLVGLRETDDLDFKQDHYKTGAEGASSLSGDVAALANSGGGAIVLGVEDKDAQAVELTPVAISDAEERRMRDLVTSYVYPFPQWDVFPVRLTGDSSRGYYVLAVAASDLRPHAAKRGHGFAYPVRDGAKTRYLSEHEIASAYRNRFALVQSRVDRLDELSELVAEPTSPWQSVPWLTFVLVPTVGTRLRVSKNLISDVRNWGKYLFDVLPPFTPLGKVTFEVSTGLRTLLLTSMERAAVRAERLPIARAVLGLDGSAAVSANMIVDNRSENLVGEDELFSQVVAGIQYVVGYASTVAGATHDALLRVDLHMPPEHYAENEADRSVHLGGWTIAGLPPVPGTRPGNGLVRSEHTIDLDAAATSVASCVAAAILPYGDLINSFGLAEPQVVSADGTLRITRWERAAQQRLRDWATAQGVPTEG